MAIWPFFRHGKRSRKQAEEEMGLESVKDSSPLGRSGSGGVNPVLHHHDSCSSVGKAFRGDSKRRKRDNGQTQSSNMRCQMANTPGLSSPPQGAFSSSPAVQRLQKATTSCRPVAPMKHDSTTNISHTSLGRYDFSTAGQAPTLYARRRSTEPNVPRRRSDKRKRDEYVREQAIKNMSASSTLLKRRATFTPGQLPADSGRRPRNVSREADAPASDFSLPLQHPDRISLSEFSDSYAYKLSALGALTPWPLLRYAEPRRHSLPRSRGLSRDSTRKGKRPVIREEDLRVKKRVEELADDLDAGALRELMERHQRRREMKRQEDREKDRRKLQQRADRQQEEERRKLARVEQGIEAENIQASGVTSGAELGTAMDSSALDHEADPMEIVDERNRPGSWLHDPSEENLAHSPTASSKNNREITAVDDSRNDDIGIAISQDTRAGDRPSPPAVGRDQGGSSSPHPPGVAQESTLDIPQPFEPEKRISDSGVKTSSTWASLFRRGGSRLRKPSVDHAKPPSDFSKTSGESLSRSVQPHESGSPPPIPERSYLRPGTVPRSQSKFIEHLNDFPTPPVGTQFQSQDVPTTIKDNPPSNRMSVGTGVGAAERYSMSMRSTVATPESGREDRHSSGANSPEPRPESAFVAHSLASIDSEGSWLSGKPVRRLSQARANHRRGSAGSTKEKLDDYADSIERDDVTGDEYFKPAVSHKEDFDPAGGGHRSSSNEMNTENDTDDNVLPTQQHGYVELENDGGTLHASVEKRAALVHPQPGPRSNEALFQDYQANESEPATPDGGDSPLEGEGFSEIRRATSVDLGKGHVRHISAGSAKLLNLPRRLSDSKRLSSGSAGSGVPPSESVAEENEKI